MTTAPPGERAPLVPPPGRSLARRFSDSLPAFAGPVVIVLGVLAILHAFAFQGRISNGDPPTYWLPTWCFLGHALRAGHVPLWNPYTLAGTPFAADPQSGWMYLPPMVLFTALSCGAAIRWMLLLHPMLAGLGLLWFLRGEGLSRLGAATGGIVLAFVMAGSEVVLSLPFAASLAWTAVGLALVARVLRARTWPRRTGWSVLASIGWGQLAAAHFSVGLLLGTLALVVYVAMRAWTDLRRRVATAGSMLGRLALLAVSLAGVNLAFLLPRLQYASRTNLGAGYAHLAATARRLTGHEVLRLTHPPSTPTWPLKLSTTPGAHVAAAALALAFAAFWSRRHRVLAVTFGGLGALCYLATLHAVAARVPPQLRSFRLFDFYLHSPEWFGYPLLLVVAVLAAIGVDAWLEPRPVAQRALMVAPGVLVWGALTPAFGVPMRSMVIALAGAVLGGLALWQAVIRPERAWLVAGVIVVEMVGAGLFVGTTRIPFRPGPSLLTELPSPSVDVAAYLRPTAAELALRDRPGRFVGTRLRGWIRNEAVPTSSVLRIRSAQGYSPTAPSRYWYFVRAVDDRSIDYNLSRLVGAAPAAYDLLGVRWALAGRWPFAEPAGAAVASGRGQRVYAVPGAHGMATFFAVWRRAAGPDGALRTVASPSFDPERTLVVEDRPGSSEPPPSRAPTSFAWRGDQGATVRVAAPTSGMLLVRIPFDSGWRASVDGRPAAVSPADYVDLAVAVPAGRHLVTLTYADPWVWYGLAGTAVFLAALALAALLAAAAGRRRGTIGGPPR